MSNQFRNRTIATLISSWLTIASVVLGHYLLVGSLPGKFADFYMQATDIGLILVSYLIVFRPEE